MVGAVLERRANEDHWDSLRNQLALTLQHGSNLRFVRMYVWVDRSGAGCGKEGPLASVVVSIPRMELKEGAAIPEAGAASGDDRRGSGLRRASLAGDYLDLAYEADRRESVDQLAGRVLADVLSLDARGGEALPIPKWSLEFGEEFRCPALPEGFEDFSWHNDDLPSFGFCDEKTGEELVRLWIDHPIRSERVDGYDGARFVVSCPRLGAEEPYQDGEWELAVAKARDLHEQVTTGREPGEGRTGLRSASRQEAGEDPGEVARLREKINEWVACGDAIMLAAVGRKAPLSDSDVIGVIETQRTTIGSLLGLVAALRNELLRNSTKDFAEFMALKVSEAHRFPEVSRHLQTFSWAADQIDETLRGLRFQIPKGPELEAWISRIPQGGQGLSVQERAMEIRRALGEGQGD
jgi:hypothetical protein